MSAVITVRNLRNQQRRRKRRLGLRNRMLAPDTFVIEGGAGISFEIHENERVILEPTSGEAKVRGFSPWREREASAFRIGVIFGQRHQLWGELPPHDSYALLRHIYEQDRAVIVRRHLSEVVDKPASWKGNLRRPFNVLASRRVGRRLAAIFAADVAGYSRLMGQDEAGTLRALSAARATLGCIIVEHGGRIANTVGDSVLAEFPSAVDAVRCAMVVQERLAELDAEAAEGLRLPFRIAVHVGDIVPSGSDIFGDGINVCARLQEFAQPRGICISGAAYQYVRKVLSVAFDDLGERTLKNIDEPVRVFAIRAGQGARHSSPQPKPSAAHDLPVAPPQAKARTLGWIAAWLGRLLA